jgi:hypothetical protein
MLASNLLNPIHRAPHLSSFMNTKSSSLIKWCLQNSANSCLGTLHQEKFSAKIAQMQSEILIQKETTPMISLTIASIQTPDQWSITEPW